MRFALQIHYSGCIDSFKKALLFCSFSFTFVVLLGSIVVRPGSEPARKSLDYSIINGFLVFLISFFLIINYDQGEFSILA